MLSNRGARLAGGRRLRILSPAAEGLVRIVLLAALVGLPLEPASAATGHACSSNAVARAGKLLVFHADPDGPWSVDKTAVQIGTVPALHGRRRYDVLQVWGYVYKARYRMRFIYGVVAGQCVLVGEEIFEDTAL